MLDNVLFIFWWCWFIWLLCSCLMMFGKYASWFEKICLGLIFEKCWFSCPATTWLCEFDGVFVDKTCYLMLLMLKLFLYFDHWFLILPKTPNCALMPISHRTKPSMLYWTYMWCWNLHLSQIHDRPKDDLSIPHIPTFWDFCNQIVCLPSDWPQTRPNTSYFTHMTCFKYHLPLNYLSSWFHFSHHAQNHTFWPQKPKLYPAAYMNSNLSQHTLFDIPMIFATSLGPNTWQSQVCPLHPSQFHILSLNWSKPCPAIKLPQIQPIHTSLELHDLFQTSL